jgi:lipopolysaccharide biosynthesis glycosyltransferase
MTHLVPILTHLCNLAQRKEKIKAKEITKLLHAWLVLFMSFSLVCLLHFFGSSKVWKRIKKRRNQRLLCNVLVDLWNLCFIYKEFENTKDTQEKKEKVMKNRKKHKT